MRGPRPRRVRLRDSTRAELRWIVRQRVFPADVSLRARLLLRLEVDPCVTRAAAALGVSTKYVRRWRDRFFEVSPRPFGLVDRPRSGRPPHIEAVTRCEVVAMACGKPADFGLVHRQTWTLDALHACFVAHHRDVEISRTSVFRILSAASVRPHRVRLWLHSPDPQFREKVAEICELYLNPPEGGVVLCVDEKPGMQALGRKHPFKLPGPERDGRWEFEYKRNGTRVLLAAFNPHTGDVYAEVRARRTGRDLVEFMQAVGRRYKGKQIHVIWDNLNIHYDGKEERWSKFNRRRGNRFHFHYTPIHASWTNQVELFFSIVQRRVLRYRELNNVNELEDAVISFIELWNEEEARPFSWTFTGYPLQIGGEDERPSSKRARKAA